MLVTHRSVVMHMRMRFCYLPGMGVLMVLVVYVTVLMVHRCMFMGMNVAFGQMQCQADAHE